MRLGRTSRPTFRALNPERLLYEGTKPGPGTRGPLRLTPLQLIDRFYRRLTGITEPEILRIVWLEFLSFSNGNTLGTIGAASGPY